MERSIERPKYLRKEILNKLETGNAVRALVRVRLSNMKEENKYWLGKEKRMCSFFKNGRTTLEHYVEECETISEWFIVKV